MPEYVVNAIGWLAKELFGAEFCNDKDSVIDSVTPLDHAILAPTVEKKLFAGRLVQSIYHIERSVFNTIDRGEYDGISRAVRDPTGRHSKFIVRARHPEPPNEEYHHLWML